MKSALELALVVTACLALFLWVLWATVPAQKRLDAQFVRCHKAKCVVGTPELTFVTAFSKGKCVCLPPEPAMPQ